MVDTDEASTLVQAAGSGDLATVERIVLGGFDVNLPNYDKRTALHLACAEGDLSMVKFLLEKGAAVNAVDMRGGTPLDDAMRAGHTETAALLDAQGAISGSMAMAPSDQRLLFEAVAKDSLAALESLLRRSVDVDACDVHGRSALHFAAQLGNRRLAHCLLMQGGADVNMSDRLGRTPLNEAPGKLAEYLRSRGGELGTFGPGLAPESTQFGSQLCKAGRDNDVRMLRDFFAEGGDVSTRNYDHRTALHAAAAAGAFAAAHALVVEFDAELSLADRWGFTPLDEAVRAGHRDLVRLLVSCRAEPGARTVARDLWAAPPGLKDGHPSQRGARAVNDVSYRYNAWEKEEAGARFPLDSLSSLSEDTVASVGHGANEIPNDAATMLIQAVLAGDLPRLRFLIRELGHDVNASNFDDRTALHIACREGKKDIVQALVEEFGARINAHDKNSFTPADEAEQAGHRKVASFLFGRGAVLHARATRGPSTAAGTAPPPSSGCSTSGLLNCCLNVGLADNADTLGLRETVCGILGCKDELRKPPAKFAREMVVVQPVVGWSPTFDAKLFLEEPSRDMECADGFLIW